MNCLRLRSGMTLIEILIFLAIFGLVVATALPLFFSATENRLLQQTVSAVEQNGAQVIQNAGIYIRGSERVLLPAAGETGSVLVLQTNSGALNPTIIGVNSGSLSIVQYDTLERISSSQVAVTNFVVRNTSASDNHPSVSISFTVSRTIRLQQPHSYSQNFEAAFNLLPDDIESGNTCECTPALCNAVNEFVWQICEGTNCLSASAALECSP